MLGALCRTYRASAAFGFRNWGGTSKQSTGTFTRYCTSTEGEGEGHNEGGEPSESDEGQMTLDDVEWDDVITLWANAHACYIEKDRSILAESKRCVLSPTVTCQVVRTPFSSFQINRSDCEEAPAPYQNVASY